jgi:hypothetical protein
MVVLWRLEIYTDEHLLEEAVSQQKLGSAWDTDRIRTWWRNNVSKKVMLHHKKNLMCECKYSHRNS